MLRDATPNSCKVAPCYETQRRTFAKSRSVTRRNAEPLQSRAALRGATPSSCKVAQRYKTRRQTLAKSRSVTRRDAELLQSRVALRDATTTLCNVTKAISDVTTGSCDVTNRFRPLRPWRDALSPVPCGAAARRTGRVPSSFARLPGRDAPEASDAGFLPSPTPKNARNGKSSCRNCVFRTENKPESRKKPIFALAFTYADACPVRQELGGLTY